MCREKKTLNEKTGGMFLIKGHTKLFLTAHEKGKVGFACKMGKHKEGYVINDKRDQINRWEEYFKEELNAKKPKSPGDINRNTVLTKSRQQTLTKKINKYIN